MNTCAESDVNIVVKYLPKLPNGKIVGRLGMSRKEVWCSKKRNGNMSVFQPEEEGYTVSEITRGLCILPNTRLLTNASIIFVILIGGKLLMAPVLEGNDVVSIGVASDIPWETGKSLLRNFIDYIL